MGFTEDQERQLQEIQSINADAVAQCLQLENAGIDITQAQQGLVNVQNILIDQSINILNGAQIQIFQGLCGEECQFDPDTPPADGSEDGPTEDGDSEGGPAETQVAGENSDVGSSTRGSGSTTRIPVPAESSATPPATQPQQQPQSNNDEGSGTRS